MTVLPQNRVFGKRSPNHVLILASGDKIRHMTVRPWMAALALSFVCVFSIGYLLATTYLVLRDDLIGATMARQARMQHDYEDRISALRAQVDRVTSRQLLDQQVVEEKVEKLLEQQLALSSRHGKLGSLLKRAEDSGLSEKRIPVPAFNPERGEKRADASAGVSAIERLIGLKKPEADSTQDTSGPVLAYAPAGKAVMRETMSDRADRLFSNVTLSLKTIEQEQMERIESLTADASETAEAIGNILRRTGFELAGMPPQDGFTSAEDATALGGPYLEPLTSDAFENSLARLDQSLERLEKARKQARKLPFGNPSPGSDITSRFGNRTDPFLRRPALHAGVDFRVRSGTRIRSTGAGVVMEAGRNGGYGLMVEIDHGGGTRTRYAHLSEVLVREGDHIAAGAIVGRSGSTGRSTGPHLHYEVRRGGTAVDPMRFLNAGLKLSHYLN